MKPYFDFIIYHKDCLDGFTSFVIFTKRQLYTHNSIVYPDMPSAVNITNSIKDKNVYHNGCSI